ncbi:TetR/AcrR family transcriptional regulator [Nocardia halotolerans]|uniref:TetR/AcrR family transcriptional regulator n=1 Tax=Nocardia halotolerans TaxID=1755878 RepID=A0ABV8VQ86_9NOCA
MPAPEVPPRPRSKKAQSQRQGRGRTPRLSHDDWVDGALALLAREGTPAIRIPRLCAELGVTKGSFYWHFDDIEQLMKAMADRWRAVHTRALDELGALDSIPVEQRIEQMTTLLVDQRTWIVEATVREWARQDPTVSETVRSLDNKIFAILTETMTDLGFDATQARLRAGAMVYLGVGLIHGRESMPIPTPAEIRTVIDLLVTPPPADEETPGP